MKKYLNTFRINTATTTPLDFQFEFFYLWKNRKEYIVFSGPAFLKRAQGRFKTQSGFSQGFEILLYGTATRSIRFFNVDSVDSYPSTVFFTRMPLI